MWHKLCTDGDYGANWNIFHTFSSAFGFGGKKLIRLLIMQCVISHKLCEGSEEIHFLVLQSLNILFQLLNVLSNAFVIVSFIIDT